jgi:hypothetical protein
MLCKLQITVQAIKDEAQTQCTILLPLDDHCHFVVGHTV